MSTHPAAAVPSLDDIQGNILKGHGRKYTALVFFRFATRDRAAWLRNRRLLRNSARLKKSVIRITSAQMQERQTELWRKDDRHQFAFCSLGLTCFGLAACGYEAKEPGIGELGSDQFWQGATKEMAGADRWEKAFNPAPDGVFLVAHQTRKKRDRLSRAVRRLLLKHYGIEGVSIENGFRWIPPGQTGKPTTCEPFGFADGFARTHVSVTKGSAFEALVSPTMKFIEQIPSVHEVPLNQLIFVEAGPFQGGSFLVIHKLEQNVQAFLQAEQLLQSRLDLLPEDIRPDSAGALFVGRERDGRALADGVRRREDPVRFDNDAAEKRCPFSAHIRKMNPRQDHFTGLPHAHANPDLHRDAQMVRRGVVYGPASKLKVRWDDPAKAPTGGVGLLFMGYMSSVGGQFLNMFRMWAPDERFPQYGSGVDGLLNAGSAPWIWPAYETVSTPPIPRASFVTTKGAGFFMIPPVSWLKALPTTLPPP